jgi:hypothetical protein
VPPQPVRAAEDRRALAGPGERNAPEGRRRRRPGGPEVDEGRTGSGGHGVRNTATEQNNVTCTERNRLEFRTLGQRCEPRRTRQHDVEGGTGGVVEAQAPRRMRLGVRSNGRTSAQGPENIGEHIHDFTLARRWNNTTRVSAIHRLANRA